MKTLLLLAQVVNGQLVEQVHDMQGTCFVCPCLNRSELSSASLQVEREIQVQRTLKHENVLRLYKHFEAHWGENQASVRAAERQVAEAMRTKTRSIYSWSTARKGSCISFSGPSLS